MITLLITGLLLLVFTWAALAPIEALGWYAGWFGEDEAPADVEPAAARALSPEAAAAHHFMVYLSGIGAISGTSVPPEEDVLLDKLEPRLTGTLMIRDVFPYSVTNLGLTSRRVFARLWRRIEDMRLQQRVNALIFLVNVRNMFQVAVSADQRYGPIYNLGVAQEIYRGLVRHGYPFDGTTPVTLLGWSGGGQIAIGAAAYLRKMIDYAPLRVISLGGVMSDDVGLREVTHLYHLYGTEDPLQAAGGVLFPGRWPVALNSPWNQALSEDRITMKSLGPLRHHDHGHYFDAESQLPDGTVCDERTLSGLVWAVQEAGLMEPPADEKL